MEKNDFIRIKHMLEAAQDIKEALSKVGAGSFAKGYADCLRRMGANYPELVSSIFVALQGRIVGLVVNQSRMQNDIDIGISMEHICSKYFGLNSSYLGYLNYDECAWKSLRNRRLLLMDFPHSMLSKRLTKVSTKALTTLGY